MLRLELRKELLTTQRQNDARQQMIIKAQASLKGDKASERLTALVDTGASTTIIDRGLGEVVGVIYTGRRRAFTSVTGQRLEGEIAVVRELTVEDEILDYERVAVVRLDGEVKKTLKEAGVDDRIILGITTLEAAGFLPDTTTGKLRRFEGFIFRA